MTLTTGQIEAALRSIFPEDTAVAAEWIGPTDPVALWPEERAAVAGAVPARLAEFIAGRTAARRVLQGLDLSPLALPMGTDRAAIWPGGLSGSIAHAAGFAVAVARRGAPLGVDLEEDAPLAPELWPILCTPDELRRLGPRETGQQVRRVFCAKEAVFKAQAADSRAMFGFDALDITLAKSGFTAQFRISVGAFRSGQIIRGKLSALAGLVLAGVAW